VGVAQELLTLARNEAWILRRVVYKSLFARRLQGDVIERFIEVYYDGHLFGETRADVHWLGTRVDKCPLDLWIYQELLHRIRPDTIIETGTSRGGSAHFLASICDLLGHGRVISIDIVERSGLPEHPRISYIVGSSVDPAIVERVTREVNGEKVLVCLDSDHRREHVLRELRAYAQLVSPGSYLIVEDTILNGHPVSPQFGPGPREAVDEFLQENNSFEVDETAERHYLTFNRRGYLRRR
jgi:cephalosporin hydroxylase